MCDHPVITTLLTRWIFPTEPQHLLSAFLNTHKLGPFPHKLWENNSAALWTQREQI